MSEKIKKKSIQERFASVSNLVLIGKYCCSLGLRGDVSMVFPYLLQAFLSDLV